MKKFNLDDVKENSKIVDINEVCFNPWNPKIKRSKEYEKVKESVRVNGLSMPIVVREIDDDNYKYQVLDGEQRLTAALDLGFDKIWIVNLGKITDEEAKSKTIWMEMAVPFDQEQLGKLLVELVDKVELPYTDNEIEVISGISLTSEDDEELDDSDFEDDSKSLETFKVSLAKPHLDKLKEEIKSLKNDYEISDGIALMIILDAYVNGHKNENVQELIENLNNEELEFYS